MTPKNMPNNVEAEQSLLCSFLLGESPEQAIQILEPEDFYKPVHRSIFNAVFNLYKDKEPMGAAEIGTELKSMGKLDGVGSYLAQLMDMPQAVNIPHVAKVIKDCSARRKVIEIAENMAKKAYSDIEDVNDLIETTKSEIKLLTPRGDVKREGSLTRQVREWVKLTNGYFSVNNCYNELGIVKKEQKATVRVAFHKLLKDGVIIQDSNKDGFYRLYVQTMRKIDLADRTDIRGELPIKFPLGIENFIKPMPGCVYIIAGETDSGKTAFLMNFAKKNVPVLPVNYFSSEAGKEEFLDRTDHFWPDIGEEKNFIFYEDCFEDFDKMIKPDEINIIDYLDLFDNFYLMSSIIDRIGRKLNNGVVFIALQKPKNRDEGTGGERTKNLSRLYLALKPGVLKIVKGKNWRDSKFNPNNLEIEFKLAEGCKFVNTTPWRKP